MRIVLYIVILLSLLFVPVHRLDIACLEPVEVLAVSVQSAQIRLETDCGYSGNGRTVSEAIDNLKENTPGVIYLDTAEYLLITEETIGYLQQLAPHLREHIKVCIWDGRGDVSELVEYLEIRTDLPSLSDMKNTFKKS